MALFLLRPSVDYQYSEGVHIFDSITLALEIIYTTLVIFRWDSMKKYVPTAEALSLIVELLFYNSFVAKHVLDSKDKNM